MEEQPENKDVNKDLKAARKGLLDEQAKNERTEVTEVDEEITITEDGVETVTPAKKEEKKEEKKAKPAAAAKPKGFKRVAIEEDSSDEEPATTDDSKTKNENLEIRVTKGIDSPFPHKNAKEIEAHARESKRLMKVGADAFQKRWANKDEELLKQARKDAVPLIEEIDTEKT